MTDPLKSLETLVQTHKLAQHRDLLLSHARHAVALGPRPATDQELARGASKLGGEPDVPPEFQWPIYKEEPLAFVGQINLNALPPFTDRELLPESGIMSFFYNNYVWGFDPKDKGGFRVYHFDGEPEQLVRCAPPSLPPKKMLFGLLTRERKVRTYKSCALDLVPMLALPDFDRLGLPDDDEEETDRYYDLLEALGGHHRLLGYPEPIQGEMELECELVANNFYCGDSKAYKDPRAKELEAVCHHWRLLLQVDSDDKNSDMMWGDAGRLYFWIKEEDLRLRQFDNSWLISQCY